MSATLGRPTGYSEAADKVAFTVSQLGGTHYDVAKALGVSDRTVMRWARQYPSFRQSLKVGGAEADDRVVESLYKRAVGYTTDAVKVMQHQGVPVYAKYREIVQPDVTACIFWLKNRRKEEWRDRHEHGHDLIGSLADDVKAARERASKR